MNLREKRPTPAAGNCSEYPLRERSADVIILGGGPAGTATAIALAGFGWSVIVLERSHYESTRIGETLPPEVKRPLTALGMWERFLADGPAGSPGIASAWGQAELYDNDFIVNPRGPGWHVDRRCFDSMLACAAEARGVEVLRGARGISVSQAARFRDVVGTPAGGLSATWRVGAVVAAQQLERRAALLVDATGRSASPARHLAGHRIVCDRLVGLVGFVSGGGHTRDRRTLIEAVECGWWYSAPLPDTRQVAAFMTDADLLPTGQAAQAAFWRDQLERSRHIRARIGDGALATSPRVVLASSSRSPIVAADGWVAVGDAAAAFDPLSSQGVTWALESGLMAAEAINGLLRGHRPAFLEYAREVESEFVHYLAMRSNYYDRERRWPNSPFWRRRHAPALMKR
jgi:flavin-dependent dehydrogenase